MTVYVDHLRFQEPKTTKAKRAGLRHGQRWCHMWADWDAELFEMAMKLNLKPEWIQEPNGRFMHLDLVPTKREKAIELGAIEMSLSAGIRMKARNNSNLGLDSHYPKGTTDFENNSYGLFSSMLSSSYFNNVVYE